MVETLLSVEVNATDRGATVVISVDAIECQAFLTIELQKLPVGGKTAPAFWTFWKKCRFHHSETTDSFPKIGFKFPGNLKCFFDDVL